MVIVLTNLYLYVVNRRNREARADAGPARDRQGRLGPDRVGGGDQPDLLLPGALDHPHRLQVPRRRAGGAAEFLFFKPTLDNFVSVFSRACITAPGGAGDQFRRYFFNSIFIAGTSVLLALIIGTLAAYGFSRYPLKGNDTYLFIILTTRMLPAIVVIIPIFLMFRVTGLSGSYLGIILLYTAFNLPFTDLDDEELLRRTVASTSRTRRASTARPRPACSSRSACRRSWPASPPPSCSA